VHRIAARAITSWALLLVAPACGSSPAPAKDSATDARGCSHWPSRGDKAFISLDGESQFEVESFLVERQGDLAIAWEAYGCDDVTRVGYTRRRSGVGFDEIRYLSSPNSQMASNVTLALDRSGSLFAAWASWTPGPDRAQPHLQVGDIHIQLARWSADSDGFAAPVGLDEPIADSLYDKPWAIVTADDVVIVSYSDVRRGGIWTASSADGGASFRRVLVDAAMANLASLCPDGRPGGAFVVYVTAGAVRVAHSADGGVTWSSPLNVAVSNTSGAVAYQDPMCVARGDDVWLSYGRTHDGYDTPVARLQRVQIAHMILDATMAASDVIALAGDAGDGPVGSTTAFLLFPQLAAGPDGTLVLAAYRATGEGIGTAELVSVVSADGGLSFGKTTTFASGLTPSLRRHVPDWLGDYFGWAPTLAGMGAAFIDNASGFSHVVFDENVLSSAAASRR
jgi:hypothetical protein